MDVIRWGGNVWIKHLDALVSVSCESMTVQPVSLGESCCGYSHTYLFDHVIMRVLNCGYICQVAVILKYIHRGMYI
jgi:hypothetical protein